MRNFLLVFLPCLCGASDIFIGAIFDDSQDENAKAFNYALDKINEANALKKIETKLVPLVQNVDPFYPFESMQKTCELLNSNVFGIFGPKSESNIDSVQSVCDEKEIPHIITRWMSKTLRHGTMINLFPDAKTLGRSFYDIISAWGWTTFTILYDDNESLIRLSELIKLAEYDGIVVSIKQLDQLQTGNYRPTLKEVKKSEQKYFVIDCKIEILKEVLIQCQQIGLVTNEYHYFVTNLDMHTEDLEDFQYSETNITGIRLLDPYKENIQQVSEELFDEDGASAAWKLRSETALLIDSLNMFSKALEQVTNLQPVEEISFSCNGSNGWEDGYSVINLMKTSVYNGLSGKVIFDNEGSRSEFQLGVYELLEGGITNVATWNSTNGLNISRVYAPSEMDDEYSLQNKTFIVITTLTEPYGMLKDTQEPLTGNDRFEGFGIDLIHELSIMEGFHYVFILREDKKNGAKDLETGKWTGMIGDLMEYRADLAITDLTITSERAEAVDFTDPFMNLGISILFREPEKAPPSFFSFAEPFALDTWIGLVVAYLIVSISLYIMGRLSPAEWTNPYPCIEEPEYLINQFSLRNSFWFTTGSLMQQGTEIAPIGVSTRMVAGMWWFFVLIIIASYTANLAAFLATENPINLFKDIQSLVANAEKFELKWGAKSGGATANFFRDSTNPTYKQVYKMMEKWGDEVMVKENGDGVQKAEDGRYAFFMESTSIEYVTERKCDLQMYGGLLDEKGYGIAMRKNSPYRHRLSTAILQLQSSGALEEIKRKWWQERHGGGQCGDEKEESSATPLGIVNCEGVFYVTIGGAILSIIFVMIEYVINIYHISRQFKISYREAFKIEWKNFVNFDSNVKPTLHAKSESKSKSGSKSGSEENLNKDKDEKSNPEKSSSNRNGLNYGFKPLEDINAEEDEEGTKNDDDENSKKKSSSTLASTKKSKSKSKTPAPYGFNVSSLSLTKNHPNNNSF